MKTKNRKQRSTTTHQYWQSYSDMMAALLLMFVLIMVFTLSQSMLRLQEETLLQAEQSTALAQQQSLLETQSLQMETQSKQMEDQQAQIDELIGIKIDIIRELSKTFQNSNLSIEIDEQTGAITMDSKVLFQTNSATISQDGLAFIDDFLPLYISVLLHETYCDYVSEIIIEGHTDTTASYMYNLNLSQERAYSVAAYCLDEENSLLPATQLELLRNMMTANGRSFSNPIYNEDGTVDAEKSRRVEIKFRLKDDEMINQMQSLLEGSGQ